MLHSTGIVGRGLVDIKSACCISMFILLYGTMAHIIVEYAPHLFNNIVVSLLLILLPTRYTFLLTKTTIGNIEIPQCEISLCVPVALQSPVHGSELIHRYTTQYSVCRVVDGWSRWGCTE